MMEADVKQQMIEFLRGLGSAKCRGLDWYMLDKINSDFYLTFDLSDQPDSPLDYGTADVYLVKTAEVHSGADDVRLLRDADEESIANLLSILDLPLLSEEKLRVLKCYGMREADDDLENDGK